MNGLPPDWRGGRPRNEADAWVEGPGGERYWGRYGAAGLLAHHDGDDGGRILLQHRATWSHHGGTWGVPGGARHRDESATQAALRESDEEAGVPATAVHPFASVVVDREVWSYTTVLARVSRPFEPVLADAESEELAWVPVDRVDDLPLHPGFGAAWPRLRPMLARRPRLVVDAANVVGAVPDGWWRDRSGAAARLAARLGALVTAGVPASALGLEGDLWHPEVTLVLEGRARGAAVAPPVTVLEAPGAGDDALAAEASRRADEGETVVLVTSDRGLRERVPHVRAEGARWLLDLLERVN
ncbi:NUDIX domain-containing protein [Demequina pelophila]|uniref:NUDIX domain-containing protein n=1 Tax=Demequina pelophila TaxID=1638984 RepID=UPI000780DDCE|nr:NUDIX domain-containing protein [Demequina pelophila]